MRRFEFFKESGVGQFEVADPHIVDLDDMRETRLRLNAIAGRLGLHVHPGEPGSRKMQKKINILEAENNKLKKIPLLIILFFK